jgi:hypothetical protein
MKAIYCSGQVIGALFIAAVAATPTAAQSFRWPSYQAAYPVYARVTVTNQTDISVVFRSQWPGGEPERHVLGPGEHVTLETTFAPLTPKPEVVVRYRTGGWLRRPEVLSLPSGHVDPYTDNPGRVYDFYRSPSNVGEIVTLSAR